MTIANTEPNESTCKDRKLLTGASPLAANALGRIVSVAAIIAVAVDTESKREIVGLHIGPSEGLKAAITRVVGATWQRCRVHFMRNALAHVSKGQNTVVAAAIRQVFLHPPQHSNDASHHRNLGLLRSIASSGSPQSHNRFN